MVPVGRRPKLNGISRVGEHGSATTKGSGKGKRDEDDLPGVVVAEFAQTCKLGREVTLHAHAVALEEPGFGLRFLANDQVLLAMRAPPFKSDEKKERKKERDKKNKSVNHSSIKTQRRLANILLPVDGAEDAGEKEEAQVDDAKGEIKATCLTRAKGNITAAGRGRRRRSWTRSIAIVARAREGACRVTGHLRHVECLHTVR